MQLRRAVPLSLLALLASAGCVSVGPQAPVPVSGPIPPVGVPDVPPQPLPLGRLPGSPSVPDPDAAPDPDPDADPGDRAPAPSRAPGKAARPPSGRAEKPKAPPRRVRPPKPTAAHPHRHPALPLRMDELCAASEGTVPPSIVDLCLRQYGR
ncbi:hypothetical protein [Streptomyces sp. NBC_01408]|uniref:hypothetical protein n=1 Tax=Streptomyces sp. NBC_01408 TaxID=2903855 RepID=UPI002251C870|nr:hypothetical protein [Streptomyces sp. NBC_01408]MCX4695046.1 hypothetical protein [Streptomyces sp. NBC_01408]